MGLVAAAGPEVSSRIDAMANKVRLVMSSSLCSERRTAETLQGSGVGETEGEDELFLGVRGHFRVEFRDRVLEVDPGEFVIVPRGVEHRPVADDEASVLLFEPAATRNTGDVEDPEFTAPNDVPL
jgi:mannose-6-phosphate isomerase-like protein (cupin superfamily)